MKTSRPALNDIPTQVKDPELVALRRRQIVDAAVNLFVEKGFHKSTTREIAKAAGVSIGLLYEYVATKEDILYLVCDAIHEEMEQRMTDAFKKAAGTQEVLAEMIREYYLVCHRMSRHILLIYQEAKSLPPQWRKRVLENDIRITSLFTEVLIKLTDKGLLKNQNTDCVELMAHNIVVSGHMWTFRKWSLAPKYSIEEYTQLQVAFFIDGLVELEK